MYVTVVPGVQVLFWPVHVISVIWRRRRRHVLVFIPFNSKPGLHVKVQVSFWVGSPSSPNEQAIIPFSGASSVRHVVSNTEKILIVHVIKKVTTLVVQ